MGIVCFVNGIISFGKSDSIIWNALFAVWFVVGANVGVLGFAMRRNMERIAKLEKRLSALEEDRSS
jgi:hypothetical protein